MDTQSPTASYMLKLEIGKVSGGLHYSEGECSRCRWERLSSCALLEESRSGKHPCYLLLWWWDCGSVPPSQLAGRTADMQVCLAILH
eukprot:3889874-Amphidinium_carterae.1